MRFFILVFIFIANIAQAQVSDLAKDHDSSQPVEITADALEVFQEKQTAVFSGNVDAKQGELILRADKMTVYYREGGGNNKAKKEGSLMPDADMGSKSISKIVAIGDVFIISGTETAKGEKGVFDVDNNIISLSGSVVLTNGENTLKGDSLIYDIGRGKSKLVSQKGAGQKGRVRGVFVPGEDVKEKFNPKK